jgi:hypothetical protein
MGLLQLAGELLSPPVTPTHTVEAEGVRTRLGRGVDDHDQECPEPNPIRTGVLHSFTADHWIISNHSLSCLTVDMPWPDKWSVSFKVFPQSY